MKIPGYWTRCVFIVVAALLILSFRLADEPRLLQELEDSGHVLLFGIVSLFVLRDWKAGWKSYVAAGLLTISFGICTELMQGVEGGDAEVLDVVRDGLGAIAFLGCAWTFRHRETRKWNLLIRLGAFLMVLGSFVTPCLTVVALAHRWEEFPAIADFGSSLDSRFCSATNARFEIASPLGQSQMHAVRVTFQPAPYSGFAVHGPWPDWTNHRELCFTVYSQLSEIVSLNLRIHDVGHDRRYQDRFNKELSIQPGLSKVSIPLTAVERAPTGRQMELRRIRTIGLFVMEPSNSFDLYFSGFRLE
jgi:hypothetical protein